MSDIIPLSIPNLNGNEWKYLKECLDTGWVSSAGEFVKKFETDFANCVGSHNAIACVNGTSALHIALQLVGVKPGDEVIAPTITFIAPVNTIKYVGAEPVFMDCDEYYNIDIEKTIQFLKNETKLKKGFTINKKTGRRIAALLPVHVFGNAVNLDPIIELCAELNIPIVEDATESLGTRYIGGKLDDRHTGTIGKIGCFSFNGNKIITTGAGGMIVSNDSALADQARYLTTQAKDDAVRYVHNEIGYNYRMTNVQAAMGAAQLEQLPNFLETKHRNYAEYEKRISKIAGLKLAPVPKYANNNLWMYALQIDEAVYGKNREQLMAYLSSLKIETRPVWYLNHLQKPYKNSQSYVIEKANSLLKTTLNIPCSTSLTIDEIERVVTALRG